MPDISQPEVQPGLEGYYFRLQGIGEDATVSRTTYPNAVQSYFEAGDKLGIFTVDASGTAVQANLPYTVVGAAGEPQALKNVDKQAFEGEEYKYLIYYPYSETMTLGGLANLTHSVSAAQDNTEADAAGFTEFEKSDFLWDLASVAVDESNNPLTDTDGKKYVNVIMDHVCATIIINMMSEFVAEGTTVPHLINMQRTVTNGIYLTKAPTVDALRAAVFNDDKSASTLTYKDDDKSDVMMHEIKYSTNENAPKLRTFRAVVPPQIIEAGQSIVNVAGRDFKYTHPDGTPLALQPGKRYTFHVNDPSKPFIDIDEDDSWIFDVIDPVTGEKVGLLCREYIRFQPHSAGSWDDNMKKQDFVTGYPCEVTVNSKTYQTKMISSQVWVFYDLWKFVENEPHTVEKALMAGSRNQDELKEDDDPYLDSGVALRFINDTHILTTHETETDEELLAAGYTQDDINNKSRVYMWPDPHRFTNSNGGIFLAAHGQMWVDNPAGYGESSGNQREFWMHGGKIYWGYSHWDDETHKIRYNSVHLFEMPEEHITTQQAIKYGHVNVIRGADGHPIGAEVSYDPYLPGDRNVGVLVPKYINDFRSPDEGTITYPLVKIGYNNIWSKKGLRTRYYNSKKNNEKIFCYQQKDLKFDFPHIFSYTDDNGKTYQFDTNTRWYVGDEDYTFWSGSFKYLSKFDIPGSYAYPWSEYLDVYDYLAQYAPESAPLSENPARREKEMSFAKFYNFSIMAYKDLRDAIVPDAAMYDGRMACYIPRTVRFYELMNYVGYKANGKTMTSHIITRTGVGDGDETKYREALLDQKLVSSGIYGQTPLNVYTPNVVGLDIRTLGLLLPTWDAMGSGGPGGTEGFGALAAFWMNGDPSFTPMENDAYMNRSDAVALYVNKIYAGWTYDAETIKAHYFDTGPYLCHQSVTEASPQWACTRSRFYCAIRPVLKFNHQNGPNKHESEQATPAAVAGAVKNLVKNIGKKAPVVQPPSRVKESGVDVSVVLTPDLGEN